MGPLILPPGAVLSIAGAALILLVVLTALLGRERRRRRRSERTVSEVRSQLQTVTVTMREGVIAYDMDRQFRFANPAFERLTGYPTDELQEQEFLHYIHDDDRPAILAEWDRLAQGGALRDQEYRVVTRSGQVRWCSSSWEPMRDEAGRQTGYLGTEFDITERKLAEEEMRQDTELFQAVLEVEQAVSTAGLDPQTVMRVIAERSQGLTGASGAVIEAIEGEDLVPLVHVGTDAPRLKLSSSLSGACVRTGELQRSDDVDTDARIEHQAYRKLGIRSLLVVPLKDGQRMLGVLKVVSPAAGAFSDRDAKALRMLGGLMGAALSHAAAFEGRQVRLEERTRALQESEQRFKQLVDVAQEGIWVADERGVMTYVNQRMADLLGYPNGSLLGRPIFEFIDNESRSLAHRALSQHGSRPGQSQDLRFRRGDGTQLWGLVSSSPILGKDGVLVGTVGMVTDITQRKRTEDQLRRSAERLTMLHDMDQAILAAQSPAEVGRAALGRVRRMISCQRCTVVLFDFEKRQAELIAGYSGGNQLTPATRTMEDLWPGELLRSGSVRYVEDLAAVEEPPLAVRELVAEGFRSLFSAPLLVEGEVIGEITLASSSRSAFGAEHRDIAVEIANPLAIAIQHARLREELSRQTGELERKVAERGAAVRAATAELETVLYSVSQDVRTPLRHLIGFSRLLLDDCGKDLDPTALHYAERINQAADHMATLIDDLVGLSRIGRQDVLRRPVGLSTMVEDVVDQLRSQINGRRIEWDIEELPVIEADPVLAKIAIAQLLSNAVKFTRPRERAAIRVAPVEADGMRGISVQDNGVGFRMAHAGKLFGLFQRLHRPDEFEGNGAGLAIVQRIAQKHGGRVWAESEPDSGATFYLTLGGGAEGLLGSGAGTPWAGGQPDGRTERRVSQTEQPMARENETGARQPRRTEAASS